MRTLLGVAAVCLLLLFPNPSLAHPTKHHAPRWDPVDVGTDQQLRGLDATDRRHAWVSGSKGGVWKTSDGGEDLDRRQPSGRHGPAAPRRRDPAARARPGAGDRRGRRQPDLPHHRRWRDLDPDVHQRRPSRVLRLHGDVARRQAGDRDERPGRREVPDHRDQRRRRVLVGGRPGRHARRGARRGRLRRERHLPGHRRPAATRTSRPVSVPPASSTRATAATPGRSRTPRSRPTRRPGAGSSRSRSATPGRRWPSAATSAPRRTAWTCRRTSTSTGGRGPTAATWAATGPASTGCTEPARPRSPSARPAAT